MRNFTIAFISTVLVMALVVGIIYLFIWLAENHPLDLMAIAGILFFLVVFGMIYNIVTN